MAQGKRWAFVLGGLSLVGSGIVLWSARQALAPHGDQVAADAPAKAETAGGAGYADHAARLRDLRAANRTLGQAGAADTVGETHDHGAVPAAAPATGEAPPEPSETERVAVVMKAWREAIIVGEEENVPMLSDTFAQMPDRFTAPLMKSAVEDSDDRVRAFSTRVLGMLKPPAAVETLRSLLKDRSENVRFNAAWALGEMADQPSVAEIRRLHTQDRSAMVRQAAGQALERL